jgi:hypothetical protein
VWGQNEGVCQEEAHRAAGRHAAQRGHFAAAAAARVRAPEPPLPAALSASACAAAFCLTHSPATAAMQSGSAAMKSNQRDRCGTAPEPLTFFHSGQAATVCVCVVCVWCVCGVCVAQAGEQGGGWCCEAGSSDGRSTSHASHADPLPPPSSQARPARDTGRAHHAAGPTPQSPLRWPHNRRGRSAGTGSRSGGHTAAQSPGLTPAGSRCPATGPPARAREHGSHASCTRVVCGRGCVCACERARSWHECMLEGDRKCGCARSLLRQPAADTHTWHAASGVGPYRLLLPCWMPRRTMNFRMMASPASSSLWCVCAGSRGRGPRAAAAT